MVLKDCYLKVPLRPDQKEKRILSPGSSKYVFLDDLCRKENHPPPSWKLFLWGDIPTIKALGSELD